ncbi:AbrB/MazE/SpoVT family DNA-binding domain-containing protein [Cytobacillus purgationiresistens]|uniref:AbrB/MazE/SpoVT family DNA-binding domain-containing protein n=1 Tax=Cytobacillus purgationiresistens TaxID=863449 RepID=UPI003521779D
MYIKKITKNGQILIPKEIQNRTSISEGDFLYIYIRKKQIVIEKSNENQTLNQCVFRNKLLSIPVEIRRILDISNESKLAICCSPCNNSIILRTI